jgi:hypothetical protein
MSDKLKLLHKATQALWLELPEPVARDFTDIQQAAIEELQARVDDLDKVRAAVMKHHRNKKFLNVDTWQACVAAATEQGGGDCAKPAKTSKNLP